MRVFVTGASGFVGSAIVKDLLQAGHRVLGLVRSDSAAMALTQLGAEVYRGDIDNPESLKQGVAQCDAVIHTAFNHDFSKFKENCETDRRVIQALGSALLGSDKPLVITSGIGLLRQARPIVESDVPPSSDQIPRAASEEAANAVAAQGVNVYIVRLPPTVHDEGDHGFIPIIIGVAREKQQSVYMQDGTNHWPAVHRQDAAKVYRLIIEQRPKQRVFHAVAESGIDFRIIAESIGKGLNVPAISKSPEEAQNHFGWFTYFASMDCQASSELTRHTLGWEPTAAKLIDDLNSGIYFRNNH
jgi:nucleoside-diphosphate-sugar epimerase